MMDRLFQSQRSGSNALFNSQVASVEVGDVQSPSFSGALTITSIGPNGFTVAWQAASDNTSVVGYDISVDTGVPSYALAGNSLSKLVVALSPSTTYTVRVRARDAAGNVSAPLTASVTTIAQPLGLSVPVISKGSSGLPIQALIALPTANCTLPYSANSSQELILVNKSAGDVVVTLRGDAAGIINVKGAITKTLDLSLGLPITVPAGQFATLRLDAAIMFLKGSVTATASTGGAVFAGVLQ